MKSGESNVRVSAHNNFAEVDLVLRGVHMVEIRREIFKLLESIVLLRSNNKPLKACESGNKYLGNLKSRNRPSCIVSCFKVLLVAEECCLLFRKVKLAGVEDLEPGFKNLEEKK